MKGLREQHRVVKPDDGHERVVNAERGSVAAFIEENLKKVFDAVPSGRWSCFRTKYE